MQEEKLVSFLFQICLCSIKIIFVYDWIYVMIYKVVNIELFSILYLKMLVYFLTKDTKFPHLTHNGLELNSSHSYPPL